MSNASMIDDHLFCECGREMMELNNQGDYVCSCGKIANIYAMLFTL